MRLSGIKKCGRSDLEERAGEGAGVHCWSRDQGPQPKASQGILAWSPRPGFEGHQAGQNLVTVPHWGLCAVILGVLRDRLLGGAVAH